MPGKNYCSGTNGFGKFQMADFRLQIETPSRNRLEMDLARTVIFQTQGARLEDPNSHLVVRIARDCLTGTTPAI